MEVSLRGCTDCQLAFARLKSDNSRAERSGVLNRMSYTTAAAAAAAAARAAAAVAAVLFAPAHSTQSQRDILPRANNVVHSSPRERCTSRFY